MTDQPGDIYDGLEPAEQFGLALSIAANQLGVPHDYDDTPAPAPPPDPDVGPRRPRPDPSQGKGAAAPADPAAAFVARLQDALNPQSRWRDL